MNISRVNPGEGSDGEEEEVFINEEDIIHEVTIDDEDRPDRDEDDDDDGDGMVDEEIEDDSVYAFRGHGGKFVHKDKIKLPLLVKPINLFLSEEVYTVACSPTDASLVASGGKYDRGFLWRIGSAEGALELTGTGFRSCLFALCHSCEYLYTARAPISMQKTYALVVANTGHSDSVGTVAFSSDGQVTVWNTATQTLQGTLEGSGSSFEASPPAQAEAAATLDFALSNVLSSIQTLAARGGHRRRASSSGSSPITPASLKRDAKPTKLLTRGEERSRSRSYCWGSPRTSTHTSCTVPGRRRPDELRRYMAYNLSVPSESDAALADRLTRDGCESLPRARAHAIPGATTPFAGGQEGKGGDLDYDIDAVVSASKPRASLDGALVVSRGVIVPLRLVGAGRLPFFDGTLEVVGATRPTVMFAHSPASGDPFFTRRFTILGESELAASVACALPRFFFRTRSMLNHG
ncbi:hypothetical protein PR202_ga08692 [Eleusine coracana subsp. coracana]|uniref:Uncharacterized protein n=1 Tax=Eleusine coracana subsp. coracana TaxID=191504 RepID=A0AAV5C3B5_ELECO|nr:hypothetical protein PR202_ga08692 [Eleusine coracana subsp. coracana]